MLKSALRYLDNKLGSSRSHIAIAYHYRMLGFSYCEQGTEALPYVLASFTIHSILSLSNNLRSRPPVAYSSTSGLHRITNKGNFPALGYRNRPVRAVASVEKGQAHKVQQYTHP